MKIFPTQSFLLRFAVLSACLVCLSDYSLASETYLPTGNFTATGERIYLEDPNISIETFAGWEGRHLPASGITLQLEGPEVSQHVNHTTLTFRPSFQIRTLHHSEPVDGRRVKSFLKELKHQFTKKNPLTDFEILSSERLTFNSENDSLVVYASYFSRGLKLIQMHVLRASDKQQFVSTYTDVYDHFNSNPENNERVWNVLSSLDFDGSPRSRNASIIQVLILISILLLLAVGTKLWCRHCKVKHLKKIVRRTSRSRSSRSRHARSKTARRGGTSFRSNSRHKPVVLDLGE